MQTKLSQFKIGERGTVASVSAQSRMKRRLFDMGVTPGVEILLKKVAPFGDPMDIHIRGYELTLRKDEADAVTMEVER